MFLDLPIRPTWSFSLLSWTSISCGCHNPECKQIVDRGRAHASEPYHSFPFVNWGEIPPTEFLKGSYNTTYLKSSVQSLVFSEISKKSSFFFFFLLLVYTCLCSPLDCKCFEKTGAIYGCNFLFRSAWHTVDTCRSAVMGFGSTRFPASQPPMGLTRQLADSAELKPSCGLHLARLCTHSRLDESESQAHLK